MIGNLISKTLAGSVVGYVTNYLAIEMLFTEYLKVKISGKTYSLGGVVVKERKEFENQISRLVESEVIHHQALSRELQKTGFSTALHHTTHDFFQTGLIQAVPENFYIYQIPQIQTSFKQTEDFVLTSLEPNLNQVLFSVLEETPISKTLSPQQITYFVQQTYQIFQNHFRESKQFEIFLLNILRDLQELSIIQLTDSQIIEQFSLNLSSYFNDFHESLRYSYSTEIEQLLKQAQQQLFSKAIIQELAQQISQKSIRQIVGENNIQALPNAIQKQLNLLFTTGVSEQVITTLLKFILKILEQQDATVFELLSQDLKNRFEEFLVEKLPRIVAQLIPWIQERKGKLENLIQEAFRKNTSVIGNLLVNIFVGNIGSYVGIEQKIIDLLEKQDPKELANQTSEYLIKYLKDNTIGDIIKSLNQEKLLNTLVPILKDNLQKASEKLKIDSRIEIFDKPISTWVSLEQIEKELNNLIQNLIENQIKENWIYSSKLSEWLQNQLKIQIPNFAKKTFREWLLDGKLEEYQQSLKSFVASILENQQVEIEKFIQTTLSENLEGQNWQSIFNLKEENLQSILKTNLQAFLEQNWLEIREQPLRSYAQQLSEINQINESLANELEKYLLGNLEKLMEGRVEGLVRQSLENLPDNRLRGMVYKALGEELAPLSLFGGILGTGTGAGLSFIPSLSNATLSVALPGVAYGITGWATNWLAIRMLFKPYKPIKIAGKRLLFTPGVVAKNKERFSKSMGRFIGDRLLNQEDLQNSFRKNQDGLKQRSLEFLRKDNFFAIDNLLVQNKEKLAENISENIWNYLNNNTEKIQLEITKRIQPYQSKTLQEFPTENLENQLFQNLENPDFQNNLSKSLFNRWKSFLADEPTFESLIPEKQKENILKLLQDWLTSTLDKQIEKIDLHSLINKIDFEKVEDRFANFLGKSLEDLLPKEANERVKVQVFNFIYDRVRGEDLQKNLVSIVDNFLEKEFHQERKLSEIFEGRLMNLLEENLNKILKGIIRVGLEWLQGNREEIADKVYQDAAKQSNLVWTYKNAIKNTTFDLVNTGIPDFFEREFESLKVAIHQEVLTLGNSKLNTENILALNQGNLKTHLDKILGNQQLLRKIKQVTDIVLEERIFKIKVKQLFRTEIKDLWEYLKKELRPQIDTFQKHLQSQILDKKEQTSFLNELANLIHKIIERRIYPLKINQLLEGISDETFNVFFQNLLKIILNPEKANIKSLIQEFVEVLKKQKLNTLINWSNLEEDLGKTLEWIIQQKSINNFTKKELKTILVQVFEQISSKIDPDTKDFLVEKLTEAVFQSLDKNIIPLIQSINFKKIVETEISAMPPKELENLFYGFAGKYFKYLIGYGFIFGIIFGLAIDLLLLGFLQLVFK